MSIVLCLLGCFTIYVSKLEGLTDESKTSYYTFVAAVIILYIVFGIIF